MSAADYVPGGHLAVVDTSGAVLVPADTADAVLAGVRIGLAAAVPASERLAAVLDALTGGGYSGLSAVPPFAAAVVGETSDGTAAVDVIVRGAYRAVVAAEPLVGVDGLAVTSWREQTVPAATGVELAALDGDPDGRRLTLGRGVVLADVVRLRVSDAVDVLVPDGPGAGDTWPVPATAAASVPEPASAPVLAPAPEPVPEPAPSGRAPAPASPVLPPATGSAAPAPAPSDPAAAAPVPVEHPLAVQPGAVPVALSAGGVSDRTLAEDLTVEDDPDDGRPAAPPLVTAVPAAVTGGAGAEPLEDYSYLWGQTIVQAVESAAVRVEPAPADADAAAQGDHDGETVHLEQLLAARRAQGAHREGTDAAPAGPPSWSLGAPAGPTALSRTCGAGHPNPPHAAVCGRCREPLTEAPRPAPRPALGRLRLSSGGTVDLDRSVVLGRKPQANRVTAAELPRFVTVGGKEVSRNHLEVRLEDWNVLAVDLGSRNGTLLRRPGQPPVRLTAHDPVPLRTGDVLDLGEGIVVTAEDLP